MKRTGSANGRILYGLLVSLAAGVAAMAALPLFPQVQHDLGPATVTAEARISSGRTVFAAPPLGTVSAATHAPPLQLELALRSIDVAVLEEQLSSGSVPAEMVSGIEADLRGLARRLIVQILVGCVVVALLVAAVLPRRRLAHFLWAAAGGCVAASAAIGLTIATFDEAAFEEPKFTGALSRAPAVLEAFERGSESLTTLGSRYETLAGRISELLSLTTQPGTSDEGDDVAILHVSDIHSNPLGLEVVKRLARAFEVDAVVDTGDLTSFGEPLESRLADLLDGLSTPYYFVPGNHDSPANRTQIDESSKAILVDQETVDIAGVEVLGWGDPTFTADNETSTEEGNEVRVAEADAVAAAVVATRPDVLAVHDVRLAEESIGHVPLVLSGHEHERAMDQREGTLVLSVGSAGATGLGSFLVETDLAYEAEVVHIRDGLPRAVDYISFFGLGEEFEVDRELIDTEELLNPELSR